MDLFLFINGVEVDGDSINGESILLVIVCIFVSFSFHKGESSLVELARLERVSQVPLPVKPFFCGKYRSKLISVRFVSNFKLDLKLGSQMNSQTARIR